MKQVEKEKQPLTGQEQLQTRCIIPNSLGLWETYFLQLSNIWETLPKEIHPVHLIFSADNGIVKAGHVGFSADITRLHTKNMLHNGTAATQFATFNNIPYEVIDVGINSKEPIGINCKFQAGSDNFLEGPAMSEAAYQYVYEEASKLMTSIINRNFKEANLISFGEMGIGNTTTSAAVLSALTGAGPHATVGEGSGAKEDEETLAKKQDIVAKALALHKGKLNSTPCILQRLGGFDLVALTSAMVTCARAKMPFVIDGFITAVALACAATICPTVSQYAIPSHMSREKGMMLALSRVGITPDRVPLHANMALGEGTGALLMVQLLKTTYHAFMNMSSFDTMLNMDKK